MLVGDNIGSRKVVLRPIRFQFVGAWISVERRRMYKCVYSEARMVLAVSRLATVWKVRGLNPGGGEIFCAVQSPKPTQPLVQLVPGFSRG